MVFFKRLTTIVLMCGFITGLVLINPTIAATDVSGTNHDIVNLVINGSTIQPDVPAQIINDRTMVPVRFVAESLGSTVDFNNDAKTVTIQKGDMVVKLIINGKAYKNDKEISLDVPAMIIKNRTLVPVRFVSEAMGADVSWNGANKTVTITMKPAIITVTSPNDGENWAVGSTKKITWNYAGEKCSSDVRVTLYKGGTEVKNCVYAINPNAPTGKGSCDWAIPANLAPGNDYKIRVTCNDNITIYDFSDKEFSINGPITVTSPNGGENLALGSTGTITWDFTGEKCSSDVRVTLYKGGTEVKNCVYAINPNAPAGKGSCDWAIPANLAPGNDYKIRVTCNDNITIYDFSDTNFSIGAPITVTSPNGGEIWAVGSTKVITWNYTGEKCSSDVRVSVYKGGTEVKNCLFSINPNIPGEIGFCSWTIPSNLVSGNDYKIRVTCNANTATSDFSDNYFSIIH